MLWLLDTISHLFLYTPDIIVKILVHIYNPFPQNNLIVSTSFDCSNSSCYKYLETLSNIYVITVFILYYPLETLFYYYLYILVLIFLFTNSNFHIFKTSFLKLFFFISNFSKSNNRSMSDDLLIFCLFSVYVYNLLFSNLYMDIINYTDNVNYIIFFVFILTYSQYILIMYVSGFLIFFAILGYSNKKNFFSKLFSDILTLISFVIRVLIQSIRFFICSILLSKYYFTIYEDPLFNNSINFILTKNYLFECYNITTIIFSLVRIVIDYIELIFVLVFQLTVFIVLFLLVFVSFISLTTINIEKG